MGPLARAGIVFGVALLLSLLSGCRSLSDASTVQLPNGNLAPARMEKARPGAFAYQAQTLTGQPAAQAVAFAIDRRHVLTARHAVLGFPRHFVQVGEAWQETELLGANEYADAALLKLPAPLPAIYEAYPLDLAPVQAGDSVNVAGVAGHIEGLNTARLDGAVHKGDSGSPVLRAGKAVGILRGYALGQPDVAHFTDAAQVSAWLATLRK